MKGRFTTWGFLTLAGLAALLLAACGGGASEERVGALETKATNLEGKAGSIEGTVQTLSGDVQALKSALSVPAGERLIEVTAFELKGSTTATKLAPPDVDPKTLSDGFGFKAPGYDTADETKWEVSTYRWEPGNVVAFQGDKLTLHFFVVNGDEHKVWVEGPEGETVVDETVMNRGREYTFTVSADKAGVYRLICNNHEPTMSSEIVVLPRPSS